MPNETILSVVRYSDPGFASQWLCRAFGFVVHRSADRLEGGLAYVVLRLGDELVLVGSSSDEDGFVEPGEVGNESMRAYSIASDKIDAHCARAVQAGAKIEIAPRESDGGRYYMCRDPDGHLWCFGQPPPGTLLEVSQRDRRRRLSRWLIASAALVLATAAIGAVLYGVEHPVASSLTSLLVNGSHPEAAPPAAAPNPPPRAEKIKPAADSKTTSRRTAELKAEEERQRQEAEAAQRAEDARKRQAAEAARKAEEERQAAEAARKAEEERQLQAAEAARKAEEERQVAEAARKAEEDRQRQAAEDARKAEAERQAAESARKAEAERQAAEAARKAEEERKRQAAEAARKAEEERQRLAAEAARKADEERQRLAAEAAEVARKAELERQRQVAESARMVEEERQRQAAKVARIAEEERQRQEADVARKAEEERQQQAADAARKVEAERQRVATAEAARVANEAAEAKARADQGAGQRAPLLTVTPEDGARFLQRGRALLKTGDVTGARLFLERASNAGIADAAMELAETYDPATLTRLNVVGLAGDREQARTWYMRAQALGSAEATERLKSIGGR